MWVQWIWTGKFKLFDYGSKRANRSVYGETSPPDIAAAYKLINVPVDIVAGKADGVIAPQNVRQHAKCLQEAGCKVRIYACLQPCVPSQEQAMMGCAQALCMMHVLHGAVHAVVSMCSDTGAA